MLDVNHATRYYVLMPIRTFKCADTEALFRLRRVARLVNIERPALRKLKQLDDARRMEDLRAPPANRLEQLKGDRAGQWSLRVNHQFRIRFGGRAAMPKTWRSSTITEVERNEQETQPVSPGEMLAEEFLKPLGMSNYRLAKKLACPPSVSVKS